MQQDSTQNIIIYANKVARTSETFIYYPALRLKRYTPYFVGSRRGHGFNLKKEHVFIANGSGRIARIKQRLSTFFFGHNGVPFLSNQLKKIAPRLIQAHFGPESINVIPLANKLNIPLIIYYHGFDATFNKEYAQQKPYLIRYLNQLPALHDRATLILTQSNYLRDCVLELGFPPEKVKTQYIGVQIPEEHPRTYEEREPIVLFVARLVEKKGANYLIEAMRLVQEKFPELTLVIVGDGVDSEKLRRQAEEQLQNFKFVGWQSHDQVCEWMQKSLIFSVPSITASDGDSEGFGMVFIEAQSYGTPVVSTLHGGIVESVAHNTTGLLVDERNSEQLANSIIRLYSDENMWKAFSIAAYERTKREFDINMLVDKLETIYDDVCSEWNSP